MIEAATRPARPVHGTWVRIVPFVGAGVAAVTVLVGQWITAKGDRLGVFFPPFYAHWHPYAGSLAAVTAAVLGSAAALTPAWLQKAKRPIVFAAGLYVLALALGVSVGVAIGLAMNNIALGIAIGLAIYGWEDYDNRRRDE